MSSENIYSLVKNDIESNRIAIKFTDKTYLSNILKVIHDSTIVIQQKLELLVTIEENVANCYNINIEEVLALLKECLDGNKDAQLSCHIITTITSLVIQFDLITSDVYSSLMKLMIKTVTSGVESTESSFFKSCCCQCLYQIEEWKPGSLWQPRDSIFKSFKQEKSYLHQDYAVLVTKITANWICGHVQIDDNGDNGFQRQQSVEPQELRQLVSLIMENPELYTPSALFHVVSAVKEIAQNYHHISPTIFKPLMLRHMSTMDPVILHLIIFILVEFEKEILTEKEESQIINCLIKGLDHPSLVPAQRLFIAHWLKVLLEDPERDYGITKYQLDFYPSVFDPLDCQLSKLLLLNSCIPPLSQLPSDMNGALLLASVGYLHKLVWHTGRHRAVVVLFRALFGMYQRHCSRFFSQDINRFIKGLISGFPHFIPHALDFLECLREATSDSSMYLEILNLLHSQVSSTTSEDLATAYQYYLQVMKKASLQKEISPKATIKFLNHLVENAARIDASSWILGNGILAVCHNLLVCHGTKHLYTDIGDILFTMMMTYGDMDIQDRALFYYSLLTSSTSTKIQEFLKKTSGTQNFNQTISTLLPEGKSDRERCSKILYLEVPVLEWHRVSVNACIHTEVIQFQDIESYLELLAASELFIKASFKLQMCISGKKSVQAISVNVEGDNNFEPIRSILLPEIKEKDNVDVVFIMKPKFPIPTTFKSWVEFTDQMLSYRNDISDIEISLLDLMMPLPGKNQQELYDQLWKCFTEPKSKIRRQCIQSIKLVHKTWDKFHESMNQLLSLFRIKDQEEKELKYGILLASGHHVLFLCKKQEQHANVSIVTDCYHILPFVDKFLSNL